MRGASRVVETSAVSEARQPLTGFTTLKTYVPELFAVGVATFDTPTNDPSTVAHAKFAPRVDDDPVKVTILIAQVRRLSPPAFASGAEVSQRTRAISVAEQPVSGFVTVSVYTPQPFTKGCATLVFPTKLLPAEPLQLKTALSVDDEPSSCSCLATQVMFLSAPACASGGVVLAVTTTQAEAVQPLAGSVTVRQ